MSYSPCTKAESNVRLAAPSSAAMLAAIRSDRSESSRVGQQANAHGATQDSQDKINHRPQPARFVTHGNNSFQLLFDIRAESVAEAQHDVFRVEAEIGENRFEQIERSQRTSPGHKPAILHQPGRFFRDRFYGRQLQLEFLFPLRLKRRRPHSI